MTQQPEARMTGRLFPIDDALDSDAWYTPAWIFDGLGLTFDLDVAAPASGGFVPARRRLTVADDGLSAAWYGLVWCNPPYSDPTRWCRRWAEHSGGGCILLRADVSTAGVSAALAASSSLYAAPRRIQFVSGSGAPTGAVNFSTILLGRGAVADAAIGRLAGSYGGVARRLTVV